MQRPMLSLTIFDLHVHTRLVAVPSLHDLFHTSRLKEFFMEQSGGTIGTFGNTFFEE